jgi:hypothetical protein
MAGTATISEADILAQIIHPDRPDLDPDAVRSILDLHFDKVATRNIRQLLRKNNKGTITAEERLTLEKYLRVGQVLDLFQAKARISLRNCSKKP